MVAAHWPAGEITVSSEQKRVAPCMQNLELHCLAQDDAGKAWNECHVSHLLHRWVDAGKFLTGFSAVGSIAIPAILYHAEVSTRPKIAILTQCRALAYTWSLHSPFWYVHCRKSPGEH